jgi:enoyl-CoA hydratase
MQQQSHRVPEQDAQDRSSVRKVLAELGEGIGLITFNQPEKRNAMSVDMWDALSDILDAWVNDPQVRVVVLTGAGEKAFVSGADISQFEKSRDTAAAQVDYDRLISKGRAALKAFPRPVIARINGYCLGAGLAIAMLADIRISSNDSSFGIPAAKLGIAYGFEGVQRLISLVGPAHSSALLLGGERIDAAEALRIGLVNQVVSASELNSAVDKVARGIACNAPLSVEAMKLTIRQAGLDSDNRDMRAVEMAFKACFDSEDYQEGRAAFLERRQPIFRGR